MFSFNWWCGFMGGLGFGFGVATWLDRRLDRQLGGLRARLKANFDRELLARHLALSNLEQVAKKNGYTFGDKKP